MAHVYSSFIKTFMNILFYDRVKNKIMPAGDSNYSGFDRFFRRTFIALFAGAITVGVTYPFNLCFTRLSADMNGKGQKRLYRTTFDCFNMAQLEGGYKAVYSGSTVAFFSLLPTTLLMLPIYDSLCYVNKRQNQQQENSPAGFVTQKLGAASIASVIVMMLLYPLDTITKSVMVIGSRGYTGYEKGLMNCVNTIHKTFGIRGFYRGMHLALLKVVPSVYLQLFIYEYLKQYTIMADPDVKIEKKLELAAESTFVPKEAVA